jgi:hypothetical protein
MGEKCKLFSGGGYPTVGVLVKAYCVMTVMTFMRMIGRNIRLMMGRKSLSMVIVDHTLLGLSRGDSFRLVIPWETLDQAVNY